MSKHDGKLYYIREEDLKLLKSNPKEFWDGVTIIYDKAFRGLTDLESITIPNSVTEIYQRVFSGCKNLKKIVLPNKLEFIGRYSLPCEVDIGMGN